MENIFDILTTIFTLAIAINTFIITHKAFKQEHTINMLIKAHVDAPSYNRIDIKIENYGNQPFTVKMISIGIGTSSKNQKILIKKEIKKKIKLCHGDTYKDFIEQSNIYKGYHELNIKQSYNQLLWINVTSSLNQTISKEVYIHQGIIKGKLTYSAAEPFIATDIFLGLPQMQSYMPSYYYYSRRI